MKNDYTQGHQILTEEGIQNEWREFYIRNPARFAKEYLGIKLTPFQRMVLTIVFWNRGNKK